MIQNTVQSQLQELLHVRMRPCWGRGKVCTAGEVEIPAMAAEAGRETRQGADSDEESDGCDGAQDCEIASA